MAAAVEARLGLWLDEQRHHLRLLRTDPSFETNYAGFDSRRAQLVRELETECDYDLARCELNGQDAVGALHPRLLACPATRSRGDALVGTLADQEIPVRAQATKR